MPEKEEIVRKVTDSLIEALGVDEEEVKLESSLTEDLGAESIDFLDIIFRLEKVFNIKIPRGDLFPENILNNAEYVKNGKLTGAGIQKLREKYPFADFSDLEDNREVSRLGNLFTVGMIVEYLASRLA